MGRYELELLDPPLFAKKLAMLVAFSAAFIPLKYYELDQALFAYVLVLVILHVYFLGVLIWRVRWKVLAQQRRSFLLRLVAIVFFIALLAILRTGVSFGEFLVFLSASFGIHVLLLLSLSLLVRAAQAGPLFADST